MRAAAVVVKFHISHLDKVLRWYDNDWWVDIYSDEWSLPGLVQVKRFPILNLATLGTNGSFLLLFLDRIFSILCIFLD